MAFAPDAHQIGIQVLHEDPTINKGSSQKFRMGTLMSTVSSKEG
jgi:hypothetical protein